MEEKEDLFVVTGTTAWHVLTVPPSCGRGFVTGVVSTQTALTTCMGRSHAIGPESSTDSTIVTPHVARAHGALLRHLLLMDRGTFLWVARQNPVIGDKCCGGNTIYKV